MVTTSMQDIVSFERMESFERKCFFQNKMFPSKENVFQQIFFEENSPQIEMGEN